MPLGRESLVSLLTCEGILLYSRSFALPKEKLPRRRGKATDEYSISSIYARGSKIYARRY